MVLILIYKDMQTATRLLYKDINVGAVYEFSHTITDDDVEKFAALTDDYNPLHIDKEFGAQSMFGKNIVHGMLAASFFSTLVGMYCPGERALYMSQTLQFKKPIFYNDEITVRGTIIDKTESVHLISIKTEVIRDGVVVIDGEAKVKMMN